MSALSLYDVASLNLHTCQVQTVELVSISVHVCLSMAMLCLLMLTFWLLCLRMPPCKGQICVLCWACLHRSQNKQTKKRGQRRSRAVQSHRRTVIAVLWSTLSFTSDISPVFWAGLISLSQPVYVCVYVCVYSVFVQALIRCTVFWTAGWKLPGSQNSGHNWNARAALLLFCLCLHLLFSYRLHTHTRWSLYFNCNCFCFFLIIIYNHEFKVVVQQNYMTCIILQDQFGAIFSSKTEELDSPLCCPGVQVWPQSLILGYYTETIIHF